MFLDQQICMLKHGPKLHWLMLRISFLHYCTAAKNFATNETNLPFEKVNIAPMFRLDIFANRSQKRLFESMMWMCATVSARSR